MCARIEKRLLLLPWSLRVNLHILMTAGRKEAIFHLLCIKNRFSGARCRGCRGATQKWATSAVRAGGRKSVMSREMMAHQIIWKRALFPHLCASTAEGAHFLWPLAHTRRKEAISWLIDYAADLLWLGERGVKYALPLYELCNSCGQKSACKCAWCAFTFK